MRLQDRIHDTVMQDLDRKKKRSEAIQKRAKANQWGVTAQDEILEDELQGGDTDGLHWARTETQTLEKTRDSFHSLLDDLLSSLDDLNKRHVADVGYLLFRIVGTNQYYERKRLAAEQSAIMRETKVGDAVTT
jgi:hypothetical protein